jgi:hypothetical protein
MIDFLYQVSIVYTAYVIRTWALCSRISCASQICFNLIRKLTLVASSVQLAQRWVNVFEYQTPERISSKCPLRLVRMQWTLSAVVANIGVQPRCSIFAGESPRTVGGIQRENFLSSKTRGPVSPTRKISFRE